MSLVSLREPSFPITQDRMEALVNPRGDLPPPDIQPTTYHSQSQPSLWGFKHRRISSCAIPTKKAMKKQCHDWIFSTASNVHVAIDKVAFKNYVSFKSYVLTVSDQRQIAVRGIGTVELKIRRAAGSKENHTIHLENVLHVPDWLCNIISDIYFTPAKDFEHTWTQFGVNFFQRELNHFKSWGYTENFCGLDRLVLAKNLSGRSPMLADPDREVFSISLKWPQSQQDKWGMLFLAEIQTEAIRLEKLMLKQERGASASPAREVRDKGENSPAKPRHAHVRIAVDDNSPEPNGRRALPDISMIAAHMRNRSVSSLNEIEGNLEFLKRMSSLNFHGQKRR